jgi:hypothetical protein
MMQREAEASPSRQRVQFEGKFTRVLIEFQERSRLRGRQWPLFQHLISSYYK